MLHLQRDNGDLKIALEVSSELWASRAPCRWSNEPGTNLTSGVLRFRACTHLTWMSGAGCALQDRCRSRGAGAETEGDQQPVEETSRRLCRPVSWPSPGCFYAPSTAQLIHVPVCSEAINAESVQSSLYSTRTSNDHGSPSSVTSEGPAPELAAAREEIKSLHEKMIEYKKQQEHSEAAIAASEVHLFAQQSPACG